MDDSKKKSKGAKSPSNQKRKTSDEEERWWDALYMYVKNNILQLDPNLNLNRYTVFRLKGMAQGCFICKDRDACDLTYGYRTVLAAFDKMAPVIKYGFENKQFANYQHKLNWMFAIVEPHLNEAFESEETERLRYEVLSEQSAGVDESVDRYQSVNKYINSGVEFKSAKAWDKKHEDMW